MIRKIFLVIVVLAAFGNGIPLESSDMSKFFPHRIVGGEAAPEGYAPHMAALVIGFYYTNLICGGSIVATNVILTAAHCIDILIFQGQIPPTFHAVVGTNRWNSGIQVPFKAFHVHPQWTWDTIKYDIGFLILDRHVTLSASVGVLPLNFQRIERNEASFVTGWGMIGTFPINIIPFQLQLLDVETISHEHCARGIAEAGVIFGSIPPPVDADLEICTLHSVGHGMCSFDSGSALVSRKSNTQIGIVSWGFPCAVGAPDVFVRISGFKKYIQEIMTEYN